jgi:hypothetical protein
LHTGNNSHGYCASCTALPASNFTDHRGRAEERMTVWDRRCYGLPPLLILFLGPMLGCSVTTDPGRAGAPIVGSWTYSANQATPAAAGLQGVLSFSAQSGANVSGSMDVLETDASGLQRRLAGPLSGKTIDSTTLDVEVTIADVSRRHVGLIRGDSITGNWIELPINGGAISASGTFRAKRRS